MESVQFDLLESVLKAVRVGIVVLDSDQRVVLWNQWMEQHSELSAPAVLGKTFAEVFPQMIGSRTDLAIQAALRNNFASLISQTLNKMPFPLHIAAGDGAPVPMQQAVQVMPIAIAAGARHCLIQITDVTLAVARDRKLREQAVGLQAQIFSDGLTGIANRRRFDLHLEDEFRRAKRNGVPLTLIMIDVDSFKNYNDNYGHQRGDECLIRIAAALSRTVGRPCDLVARYGGEEFGVILPDTSAEGAQRIAESMRAEVEALEIGHAYSDVAPHVTISLGVVTQVPHPGIAASHMIGAADRALYRAKHSGKNCVAACCDGLPAAGDLTSSDALPTPAP
jgi:diguanylate cyclase (GGDEF)-like protein